MTAASHLFARLAARATQPPRIVPRPLSRYEVMGLTTNVVAAAAMPSAAPRADAAPPAAGVQPQAAGQASPPPSLRPQVAATFEPPAPQVRPNASVPVMRDSNARTGPQLTPPDILPPRPPSIAKSSEAAPQRAAPSALAGPTADAGPEQAAIAPPPPALTRIEMIRREVQLLEPRADRPPMPPPPAAAALPAVMTRQERVDPRRLEADRPAISAAPAPIEVRIGRIEVLFDPPTPPAPRTRPRASATGLSLGDYLKQRDRGST